MAWGEPLSWTTVGGAQRGGSSGSFYSPTNTTNYAQALSTPSTKKKKTAVLPKDWMSKTDEELQGLLTWSQEAAAAGYDVSGVMAPLTQELQNRKTKARETEARGLLDQIIGMYAPGGTYGQGTEAMLDRQKTKSVASGSQALVSSGLYNTTQTAGLGKKFEEEVAMPTRVKLEDMRMQNYSQALGQKANLVTGISESPMDYAMLANLIAQGNS